MPDARAPQCGHLHPAWLPPRRSGPSPRRHATSPTPSRSLPCLTPPLVLSPSRAEHHRRRCPLSPWPPSSPRLSEQSTGSASISRVSPSARTMPDALPCPLPRHLRRLCPEIAGGRTTSSSPPRARRGHRSNRRELLSIFPLTPLLVSPSSSDSYRGQIPPPLGLVAGVAPATIWSCQRVQRVCGHAYVS